MRVLLVAINVLVWTSIAAAQGNFLSSHPGDLTTSHAPWDNQQGCDSCHINNTREVSNQKCLDCHDHNDLKANIADGKGFHASALVKGKKCSTCHGEHKGRTYADMMGWSKIKDGQKFDHALTGWPLKGKHKSTECAQCHTERNKSGIRTYMGTNTLCGEVGCHAKDQPHGFVRKDMLVCDRCHNESVWFPAKQDPRFNHDDRKDAAMPILGSHKDVMCQKCHPKSLFNLPQQNPTFCGNAGCHQSAHKGQLFDLKSCDWCHSPTFRNFKQQYNKDMPFFDHTERTRFDLGAHKKLKCYDCHSKALGQQKPIAACEQCHAKDNKHGSRFDAFGAPPKCGTCHPTTSWKQQTFDHGARTKFVLTARHKDVKCRACHRGSSPSDFENFKGDTTCMNCHQHKTVHSDPQHPNGRFKSNECLDCHEKPGSPDVDYVKTVKKWHGPDSKFPLEKAHKHVACEDCHKGRDAKGKTSFAHISAECGDNGCHQDSLHKGTLGKVCSPCHASGEWDWPALKFTHAEPVFPDGTPGFPLKGDHKKTKCAQCHTANRTFKDTPRNCGADTCHLKDDAHKARLGNNCAQCHNEMRDSLFNHNTMSAFHLDGAHVKVSCADCHPSVTFKPRPKNCFGCHAEPTVHKGQYGTQCEQCHSTRMWEDIKPMHDVGDFALRGMHDNIPCARCHRDSRPLAGSGNLCINCHRQDDIHNNSLSPRCGDCHTQWSFTPARFDHTRVGCNLVGVHRTIACFDCHKNGNFVGLSPQCASCHASEAPGSHGIDRRTTCAGCHKPNAWSPQFPSPGGGFSTRESVCR